METLRSVSFLNDTINDTHSNSVEPSDCDGINVNRANILIVPFIIIYYLPVLYLFLPITVAIVRKCRYVYVGNEYSTLCTYINVQYDLLASFSCANVVVRLI